ncbi:hypothetical protein BOTBODRAFT_103483 [Botryobasidium botryosum FD-172 SS1]|uniref:tRNA N(3)-methylcytidine methyltransferase n=1 Tax=Botryobasidium botryosum (strain FD-172 SS1) TaxID=930990 RepID=A0A067N5N9_BOTB1|nr:hypothetical protein BOTBODRAFT_103483 [Botryobasidium botryosum FD-172 SS1]
MLSLNPPKSTSSVHDIGADAPPFGSRLHPPFRYDDVWSKSAWDHVPPPDDQKDRIEASLARQHSVPVPDDEKRMYPGLCPWNKYNDTPARFWNKFYANNSANFFKDRKWLHLEFPELLRAADPNAGPMVVLEVGCGAGNAVFPLLSTNKNPDLRLFACDYSSQAIKVVQSNLLYTSPPIGSISASVWDLASPPSSPLPDGLAEGSVDIVVLIFVLSALHPNEWDNALSNAHRILKPGGQVLFRDYGRYDLTQLRFKERRLLEENLYIRGDGTRVYFFELDELAILFTGSSAPPSRVRNVESTSVSSGDATPRGEDDLPDAPTAAEVSMISSVHTDTVHEDATLESPSTISHAAPSPAQPLEPSIRRTTTLAHPLFSVEQLGVDRRLLVNRKRQLKMYRVWMQAKFRKVPGS